jgi:hypothetical protein
MSSTIWAAPERQSTSNVAIGSPNPGSASVTRAPCSSSAATAFATALATSGSTGA